MTKNQIAALAQGTLIYRVEHRLSLMDEHLVPFVTEYKLGHVTEHQVKTGVATIVITRTKLRPGVVAIQRVSVAALQHFALTPAEAVAEFKHHVWLRVRQEEESLERQKTEAAHLSAWADAWKEEVR